MKFIVRPLLSMSGVVWFIFIAWAFLHGPEQCVSLPGNISPDDERLNFWAKPAVLLSMAPLLFALGYNHQVTVRRFILLFVAVVLVSGLAALCCYGLMLHVYLTSPCGAITVD